MDEFASDEPSPSYSPQPSPPAEEKAADLSAAEHPLVHQANPAASPIAAGGCSSGEAAPVTPVLASVADVVADAAADAADEAWKCNFCQCVHAGAVARFLACSLCGEQKPAYSVQSSSAQSARGGQIGGPAADSESDAVTSYDEDEDTPLSRRAPAAGQPASASSKHKLPAADRPAKKLCQSRVGGGAGGGAAEKKPTEEAEERRYDHVDSQLYSRSSFLEEYGDEGAARWEGAKPAERPATVARRPAAAKQPAAAKRPVAARQPVKQAKQPAAVKQPAAIKQPAAAAAERQGSCGAARKQPVQPASSYAIDETVKGRWWADAPHRAWCKARVVRVNAATNTLDLFYEDKTAAAAVPAEHVRQSAGPVSGFDPLSGMALIERIRAVAIEQNRLKLIQLGT